MRNAKRRLLLMLLAASVLMATALEAPAQIVNEEWVETYNGSANDDDGGSAMVLDGDGSIYVTGYSHDTTGGKNIRTMKYAPDGTELWTVSYDSGQRKDDEGVDIAVALDPNGVYYIYVTGISGNGSNLDYVTIKYDSRDGNSEWVTRYNSGGNDVPTAIAVDIDGDAWVTGVSNGDWYTACYANADGAVLQDYREDPGTAGGEPHDIAELGTECVYVTGTYAGGCLTMCYDSNGPRYHDLYDGPANGDDSGEALVIDESDPGQIYIYVTGFSERATNPSDTDYLTIKYSEDLRPQWIRRDNHDAWDRARDIALAPDGNVCVTGESVDSDTRFDYVTVKYSSQNGDIMWVDRYDGPASQSGNNDRPVAIAVDAHGYVYVTGYSMGADYFDYATLHYDPHGCLGWVARYDGDASAGEDKASDICLFGARDVYVMGTSSENRRGFDFTTIKYRHRLYLDTGFEPHPVTGPPCEGSPEGVPLPDQLCFYEPLLDPRCHFGVYTYEDNILGIPAHEFGGGQQLAAGVGAGDPDYARVQHDVAWGSGTWNVRYDALVRFAETPPAANNIGSFSVQPPAESADYVHLFTWVDPNDPVSWNAFYRAYEADGTQHAWPGASPGPEWADLAADHWYRFATRVDFDENRIVEVRIADPCAGVSATYAPPDWYLGGGAAGPPGMPTAFRLFAGGMLPGNIAAWDNLRVWEECQGDLDGDLAIELSDLAQLLAHYPTSCGALYEQGDLDGDGDVDLSDLGALLAVYGTTCP